MVYSKSSEEQILKALGLRIWKVTKLRGFEVGIMGGISLVVGWKSLTLLPSCSLSAMYTSPVSNSQQPGVAHVFSRQLDLDLGSAVLLNVTFLSDTQLLSGTQKIGSCIRLKSTKEEESKQKYFFQNLGESQVYFLWVLGKVIFRQYTKIITAFLQ